MSSFAVMQKHLSGGVLDPDIQALLDELKVKSTPSYEELSVQEAREASIENAAVLSGAPPQVHKVFNTFMEVENMRIPLRVYVPNEHKNLPGLVYYHGGGWVICNLDTHDSVCRALCREAGCVVVSVHYRLAPEHPFPAAVVDAYAAVKWVRTHADQLNIDTARVAVGGDSAGGNLAIAAAILNRKEEAKSLCFQLLVYPVTNLSRFDTPSYQQYETGYFLTQPMMQWFKNLYICKKDDLYSSLASPLLAEDLSGLPPTLVITAEFDPLRDEGEAFAKRLHESGVPVQCSRYNGMVHPFWGMAGVTPQAAAAHLEAGEALQQAFSR